MHKIGCIGFGAMGSALCRSFVGAGINPLDISIFDSSEISRKRAREEGFSVVDDPNDLRDCRVVLLAVKPQQLQDVANIWLPHNDKVVVVSILAGITIKQLKKTLNISRVVRLMPNLPCQVGEGVLAVNYARELPDPDRDYIGKLFSKAGKLYPIAEDHFNAVTALSGSGPAFFLLILEAMALAGVSEGLSFDLALDMATKTMIGTGTYLERLQKHPAVIKDLITSPKGTTQAGLVVLESEGLRAALVNAVKAAALRAKELQEGK